MLNLLASSLIICRFLPTPKTDLSSVGYSLAPFNISGDIKYFLDDASAEGWLSSREILFSPIFSGLVPFYYLGTLDCLLAMIKLCFFISLKA